MTRMSKVLSMLLYDECVDGRLCRSQASPLSCGSDCRGILMTPYATRLSAPASLEPSGFAKFWLEPPKADLPSATPGPSTSESSAISQPT